MRIQRRKGGKERKAREKNIRLNKKDKDIEEENGKKKYEKRWEGNEEDQ